MLEPLAEGMSFIYKLVDPLPSNVVYVGRTIQPLELRRRAHIHNGFGAPVHRWVRSLLREGREPLIVEIERVPVEQAVAAEDAWIAHYRQAGAEVLNMRSGASGNARRRIHQNSPGYFTYGYRGVTKSGKK